MLRFLVYLIQRFYFRPLGYEKVELLEVHDDDELETFLCEMDFVPLYVAVCANPCGCISLEANGEIVWGRVTADRRGVIQL